MLSSHLLARAGHLHPAVCEEMRQGGCFGGPHKLFHLHYCAIIQPQNLLQQAAGQGGMATVRHEE